MNKYDATNPKSIEDYARGLENKSLRDYLDSDSIQIDIANKGSIGNILEEYYFNIAPGNISEPDFKEAGVELKSTGMKYLSNGELRAKERLVLNMINFMTVVNENWGSSSFLKKNAHLLLMFYLFEKNISILDRKFILTGLWEIPEEDLRVIQGDWNSIINAVREGKAHLLSEGQTTYLGACPKGKNSQDVRNQPFSSEKAMRRAFSYKTSYLTTIYNRMAARKKALPNAIVKGLEEYNEGESFESYIIRKFEPFLGKSHIQIEKSLKLPVSLNRNAKGYYASVTRELLKSVLGVKSLHHIDEFEKGGITIRTMRVRNSTNMPVEDVSFPYFKYIDLANEEDWGSSSLRETLSRKFFFVIYKLNEVKVPILKKIAFWSFPDNDLDGEVRNTWELTRDKIRQGNAHDLPKKSKTKVIHVRPHGSNSLDIDVTPQGIELVKKSFWINASYLKNQITFDIT